MSRKHAAGASSPRSFGFLLVVVFAVIALLPLRSHGTVRWWAIAASGAMGLIALAAPSVLAAPHRWWMGLSLILAKITNPIFTSALFYLIVFPFGAMLRLAGVDLLGKRQKRDVPSYWIEPTPSREQGGSMANQF